MSPAVRTVVEPALCLAAWLLVCAGGWAIEKYESSRCRPGAMSGARSHPARGRAPLPRNTIHAAWCDWRGIRTRSAPSTVTARQRAGASPSTTDGQPGPAHGRPGRRRPSH